MNTVNCVLITFIPWWRMRKTLVGERASTTLLGGVQIRAGEVYMYIYVYVIARAGVKFGRNFTSVRLSVQKNCSRQSRVLFAT